MFKFHLEIWKNTKDRYKSHMTETKQNGTKQIPRQLEQGHLYIYQTGKFQGLCVSPYTGQHIKGWWTDKQMMERGLV